MTARRAWGLAIGLCLFSGEVFPGQDLPDRAAVLAPQSKKLHRLFARWSSAHEKTGGDSNVVIPFGFSKGLTDETVRALGHVRVDLMRGHVDVVAHGLLPGQWDLWLVDNAHHTSALPDRGDTFHRVATLTGGAGVARSQHDLGARFFADFDVDVVALSRHGQDPTPPAIAYGMPSLFQRLYTQQRKRTGGAAPVAALRREHRSPAWWGPAKSYAADSVIAADAVLDALVAQGAELFVNETFAGNGRTCATCHPAANNFTLDPAFIATLPDDDPLFVAEFDPQLAALEEPTLLRARALILENVDGFSNPGVLRSVPHTLGLATSLEPVRCTDPAGCQAGPLFFPFLAVAPEIDVSDAASSGFSDVSAGVPYPVHRTGWGGDGAPGSGSLREFAIGAVVQHTPKTLNRVPDVDFRLPTDAELDALAAFQLSLGREEDPDIASLAFANPEVSLGRDIFMRTDTAFGTQQAGKCVLCHADGGANTDPAGFGAIIARFGVSPFFEGNQNFSTGVIELPDPAEQIAPGALAPDSGFGVLSLGPGQCLQGHFDPSQLPPAFVVDPAAPAVGGFGSRAQTPFLPPNLCTTQFNTPSLIEAADTAPFFHGNQVDTLEQAVASYSGPEFNQDTLIELFIKFTDSGLIGIQLTAASNAAVAKFLRVLNALENLRQAEEFTQTIPLAGDAAASAQLAARARDELEDAKQVLGEVALHPAAVGQAQSAIALVTAATRRFPAHPVLLQQALNAVDSARADMLQP